VKDEAGLPQASIIIGTYNRAEMLQRLLYSLKSQALPSERFEVIVVNDGSRDDTEQACSIMEKEMPNLRYFSTEENLGISAARNRGIANASGKYILFTDDDCIAAEDWVERSCAALDKEEIAAGAVASDSRNFLILCHNIAQFHPFLPGRPAGTVEFVAGANLAIRKDVLLELNGFQDSMILAGDMDLILRARIKGHRAAFVPDAVVTHAPDRKTVSSLLKYAARHASATIVLRHKYSALLKTPKILYSRALLLGLAPLIAFKATMGIYWGNRRLIRHILTMPLVFALKLAWCKGAADGLAKGVRETG
jgi:glycosyltransferase involved in cell wall biosynthesis